MPIKYKEVVKTVGFDVIETDLAYTRLKPYIYLRLLFIKFVLGISISNSMNGRVYSVSTI